MGFEADHRFNVDWLQEARRILKPDGTIWATGTHHIIFSLGFALQSMNFKLIKQKYHYRKKRGWLEYAQRAAAPRSTDSPESG